MALINWKHLPVDSLNGVRSNELKLLSELSSKDHQNDEGLSAFIKWLEDPLADAGELPELPSDEDGVDLDAVEVQSLPRTTRDQIMVHGGAFEKFLQENTAEDCVTMPSWKLNEYLWYYYFGLKKKNGDNYAPATLVCIRAGIQRYFNLVKNRKISLVNGTDFDSANRMLKVKVREFHSSGGVTTQYKPINEGDLEKIRDYFDRSTGEKLQDEVLFTILYAFGERGQEHLKQMRLKGFLQDKTDADGNPYLELPAMATKNQSADPTRCKDDVRKQARLYGEQRDLVLRYAALLPENTKDNTFFPKPLANDHSTGRHRFSDKMIRGLNWMAGFIQQLSRKCNLTRVYSNHCIRVTRISDLRDAGHDMSDIMCITGQKSERTVRRYLSHKRDGAVRAASTAISSALKRAAEQHEKTANEHSVATNSTTASYASVEVTEVAQEMRVKQGMFSVFLSNAYN